MAASSVPRPASSTAPAPTENTEKNVTTATSKKSKGKQKETAENATSKPAKSRGSRKGAGGAGKQWDDQKDWWTWKTLTESSVSNRPAVFTADGNYFFSAAGNSVRIYSASTGKVVSTLSTSSGSSGSRKKIHGSHTDRVTSVVLNPANQYQVITASLDGCIKIWDFLEAVLLRTIDIGSPISHMCAHSEIDGQVFVATRAEKNAEAGGESKENTLVYRVSLTPDSSRTESDAQKPAEMFFVGKTRPAVSMALSHDASFLVVIGGFKSYVAMTSYLEKGFTKFVSPERLKCLACHPNDDYFATGDEKGQIRLWYCLNDQIGNMASGVEKRAQTTTLHWHAHSISTVAFTPNGAYLLSGGEESVLVIWQLQSGRKEFVPRMGSPILNVAVRKGREEEYLMGLSDGSYVFVGASTLSISRTISRVKIAPSRSSGHKAHSTPFAFHSQSSTIILPSSHPSSLQIYSPKSLDTVGELEVAPSNRVSKRDEKPIEPFVVEKVVIDPTGNWMASVDRRENEDDFSSENYLKIWRWESNKWVLNTRIDRPHGTDAISTLSFSNNESEPLLMTAGGDGCVKLWRQRIIVTKTGEQECFWVNRSRFQFRSENPSDACWSHDGTLLAICFKSHVVLINPSSNVILDTHNAPEVKEPSRVRFVGSSGRYLLVFNNREIAMWDLVSRTVQWSTQTPSYIIHALPHPKRDLIALILQPYVEGTEQRTSKIQIYGCTSAKYASSNTVPFRLRACSWYPAGNDMNLVGITESWNVVLFGEKLASHGVSEVGPRRLEQSASSSTGRTLFEDIFGASALTARTSRDDTTLGTSSSEIHNAQQALSTFSTPAYLAPPIDSLYSSLMDHFVSKRPESGLASENVQTQEDDAMAVDEDPPLSNAPVIGRTVDDVEFNSLVTLFRSQALSRPSPKKTATNGTPNGKHKALQKNGLASKISSPLVAPNGSASATPPPASKGQPSPTPDSNSPVVVGKKRKTGQIS